MNDPDRQEPRPGSRADRMRQPLAADVLRAMAEKAGVCIRPVVLRRTDKVTGETEFTEIPCGARMSAKCKPCAERSRRTRIQQIREGWHLGEEPTIAPDRPTEAVESLVRTRAHLEFERQALMFEPMSTDERARQLADLDAGIEQFDELLAGERIRGNLTPADRKPTPRRTRSTRRRKDTPDLPRLPVDTRTVGRVYTGRGGKTHCQSMLITVTLDSHGPVHTSVRRGAYLAPCACGVTHTERDPRLGTPIDPATYDYRRAALDAIHFARILDRFWQNTRRAAGWNVQYAGAVELQRRLAPHAHFTVRGTLPRALWKQIAAATYHQVWWPHFDEPVYTVDKPPTWDKAQESYVDPKTRKPLTSWQAALDALDDDPDARPAYVARLGRLDSREIKGVAPGTPDAERAIRYVTKYITKDLAEHIRTASDAQRAHADRLHAELLTLPCSPSCANWLLYGVQPEGAKAGLVPGRCKGKVHQRSTMGFTGRRVLVSRLWSNKTLADIRADNRAWVRAILSAGIGDHDQAVTDDPTTRYVFEIARPDDPDVPRYEFRILRSISERQRQRAQIAAAQRRQQAAQAPRDVSATAPPQAA